MDTRWVVLAVLLAGTLAGQEPVLRGVVKDPSGALVPGATVTVRGKRTARRRAARTGSGGEYAIGGLGADVYEVQVTAAGMALAKPLQVEMGSGPRTLDIWLAVAVKEERVSVVEGESKTVSTDAAANGSARVVKGEDLDVLSDNPSDLAADLQALAGPAAGPSGASVFIDGFSGGELPPKNSIREVRINQNPFSPEYDKIGLGRIEILTKPGADQFRGDVGYNFANQSWNSRNPYAAEKAPFHLNEIRGGLSGPVGKRASFNVTFMREWVDNGNVINAVTLDPQRLTAAPFTGNLMSSLNRAGVIPRFDFQLSANHTLTVRYGYTRDEVKNAGAGGFNLASRGYLYELRNQTVQVTETAVLSASVVNETRFQYFRPDTRSEANSGGSALQVLGAFNGGGNPIGLTTVNQRNFELQNVTTVVRGRHVARFGGRLRGVSETNDSPLNFAGTFTFSGGVAPALDGHDQPLAGGAAVNISSLESYRRTLVFLQRGWGPATIRAYGGGASQFAINTGNPVIAGRQVDVGVFAGDDWRVRPNLTVNLGVRYEAQTHMSDWRDVAPRVGVAWAPGGGGKGAPKSVFRAGFGTFYERFGLGNTLNALRFDGTTQRQLVVTNPDFYPATPDPGVLNGFARQSNTQVVSERLRAPYLLQAALGYERKLAGDTTVSVNFARTRGVHMLRSQDINAPVAYGPLVYPLGRPGLVVLMESTGVYSQKQLIVNVSTKVNKLLSLSGSYMENRAQANTDGVGTYPGRPYSMVGEYGPAATDIHHWGSLGGTISGFWGMQLNPLVTANSGPPFDITTGSDLYGTTLFNARPGFAMDAGKAGLVATPYGLLDPNPVAGQGLVGRNYGRGPGQVMMNLRVGRTFAFGAAADGKGKRFKLTTSMQVRNLLNHNNPGAIIGNITSPLFGRANQPAGASGAVFAENANNRKLEMQTRIVF